jgi:antitoxin component of MazEF toxin-antitoxin module
MAIPTLRAKNQVTLPAAVVTRAGLHVGEPLAFEVKDGAIYIKAYSPRIDNEDWLTDEVMAEIEQALQEQRGSGYDSADDMIAALRRG